MIQYNQYQYIKGIIYPEVAQHINNFPLDVTTLDLTSRNRLCMSPGIHVKWRKYISEFVNIADLPNSYSTYGSTDAIYRIIASASNPVCLFSDSYIGYKETANMFSRPIIGLENISAMRQGSAYTVIITVPDTSTGKWVTNRLLDALLQLSHIGCEIWVDLALIGTMITPSPADVYNLVSNHPNIAGVFGSVSKTYGLNHLRHGFLFSRSAFRHLSDTHEWFSDNLSTAVVSSLLSLTPSGIHYPTKYKHVYDSVCSSLGLTPTESIVLGTTPSGKRVCVTPDVNMLIHGLSWDTEHMI